MGSPYEAPSSAAAWLQGEPSLAELRHRCPGEWESVARDIREIAKEGPDAFRAYVAKLSAGPRAATSERVRRAMAVKALKALSLAAATGSANGTVRFNLANGWVAQRLLFERDLVRKPVSLFWFRVSKLVLPPELVAVVHVFRRRLG